MANKGGNILTREKAQQMQVASIAARKTKARADQAAARIMRVALAQKLTPEERAERAGELCKVYGVDTAKATRLVVVLLSALDRAIQRGDPESVKLILGLVGQQSDTKPEEPQQANDAPVLIPGGVVPADVLRNARALARVAEGGGSDAKSTEEA